MYMLLFYDETPILLISYILQIFHIKVYNGVKEKSTILLYEHLASFYFDTIIIVIEIHRERGGIKNVPLLRTNSLL